MPQKTQLFDIETVEEAIIDHHGPHGLSVDLVDGTSCRFRIRRREGSVYYGVTDDGRSVVMNLTTGQFDIGD